MKKTQKSKSAWGSTLFHRGMVKVVTGLALIMGTVGGALAADEGYTSNSLTDVLKDIAGHVVSIEGFLSIIATCAGMWFVFSGLNSLRKHHTSQGQQGEHVKHGVGHIAIGVLLIGLIPAIQLLQSTLLSKAGDASSKTNFSVESLIQSDSTK